MSLILVDGSALIYRAHYAFAGRPLTSADGEPTSVVFGFLGSVLRLIEARRPEYLALVFDAPGEVFRHRLYPEYKAQRPPMPEEMAAQLPRLHELLGAWGVTVLMEQDVEADDVIATVARRSRDVTGRAWLYTGDKDFLQLLDDHVALLKPGRRGTEVTEVTADDVRREYGLAPRAMIDVFALAGDSSDNIPGCPGIGLKTAVKLIRQFGSLDRLLADVEQADGLTPRLRRLLSEHREQILLSRELFTIRDDVPLELDWESLRTSLPTSEQARALMERLGLRQIQALVDRLAAAGGEVPAGGATDGPDRWSLRERGYAILAKPEELERCLARLPAGAPLAVDTETDDLRPDRARLVGISLAWGEGEAAYVPVLVRPDGSRPQGELFGAGETVDNLAWIRPLLAPVLAAGDRLLVGQNIKFDQWILSRHGLPLATPWFDTMLASYVLDPGRRSHGLDALARDRLGITPLSYGELFEKGDRVRDILSLPLERLAVYAAEDADLAWRLHAAFAADLAAEPTLEHLLLEIEMPLCELLFRMERHGIMVDGTVLATLEREFTGELQELEATIHALAGEPFNINSPKQLGRILFEKLGLKTGKRKQTGWSTDVSVLERLADDHPLPKLVLEYRQLAKLIGTYVQSLAQLVNPETGLIHTSFNQAVAATGRLSSSDPNLQNIPIRSERGRRIRRAFVPRKEGHVFLSADYSQVELRLLAHLSGDDALRETFREGGDVHRRTAALIAGVPENEVTAEMRSRAKAINFGVIYGMGPRALARQIGVTVREASAFIDGYFGTYPGVRRFVEECKERARRTGYAETILGRRRLLPEIDSGNDRIRSLQERIAVNTPIQGSAADLIKVAMLALDRRLREAGARSLLLLQVHDELLLEVPRDELPDVEPVVRETMESAMALSVPLVVDVHTGANWEEAHA